MNWDFIYRGETKDLDDATRATVSGSFIRLRDGYTHYELGGPASPLLKGDRGASRSEVEGGPRMRSPVVLVHGFSVPYFIWDPTFEALTSAGFRVLRYDLFGRGSSDRPRTSYNIDLFVLQLTDLLDALKIQRVNLIGLSMGGPIAAAFTARFPERVLKLVLIDPAGTRPIPISPVLKAALIPGIGELALGLFGSESLVKSIASDFFDPALIETFREKYRVQLQYRGFKRAILSSLRNKMLGAFIESYDLVGKQRMPILLFWGRNDTTVPFEHSRDILTAIPRAEFHVVENCSHIPHFEKPEILNPILLNFLNSK